MVTMFFWSTEEVTGALTACFRAAQSSAAKASPRRAYGNCARRPV